MDIERFMSGCFWRGSFKMSSGFISIVGRPEISDYLR